MLDKIYYRIIRKLLASKDERNETSGGLWPRLVREASADVCREETGRIVELGCGEGLFLAKIAQANPRAELFGIDLSADRLDSAKARLTGHLNTHLSPGNALQTDFPDEYFSWCFCLNITINLPDRIAVEQLVREAFRILRPGGKLVIDIRNAFSPIIQLQYRFARFYDTGITVPLQSYRSRAIGQLLAETGFRVQRIVPIGIPANFLATAYVFVAEKK